MPLSVQFVHTSIAYIRHLLSYIAILSEAQMLFSGLGHGIECFDHLNFNDNGQWYICKSRFERGLEG